jgi:hypothetical protein
VAFREEIAISALKDNKNFTKCNYWYSSGYKKSPRGTKMLRCLKIYKK